MLVEILISLLFLIFFLVTTSLVDDELVAVTAIYRHGQRMPFGFYPTDPHKNSPLWTASPGDLTNVGKKQAYELGQWMRERYDGFLSTFYKKDEIYVLSSDEDRCISSAASKLAGLFPPNSNDIWNPDLLWQPIPVHTIPKQWDDLISTWNYILKYKKFPSKHSTFSDEEIKNLCEYMTIHTGKKISHFLEALYIRDTLSIEEFNNLSLPKWTEEVYPDKLTKMRDEFYASFTATEENTKLVVGRFFHEIIQQFDFFVNNSKVKTNVPKMKMYSGHDVNLNFILNVFKIPHSIEIPLAAALLFELRKKYTGKLYVQLVYKTDKTEILDLKKDSSKCDYDEFKKMLNRYALSSEEYRTLISSLESSVLE